MKTCHRKSVKSPDLCQIFSIHNGIELLVFSPNTCFHFRRLCVSILADAGNPSCADFPSCLLLQQHAKPAKPEGAHKPPHGTAESLPGSIITLSFQANFIMCILSILLIFPFFRFWMAIRPTAQALTRSF